MMAVPSQRSKANAEEGDLPTVMVEAEPEPPTFVARPVRTSSRDCRASPAEEAVVVVAEVCSVVVDVVLDASKVSASYPQYN